MLRLLLPKRGYYFLQLFSWGARLIRMLVNFYLKLLIRNQYSKKKKCKYDSTIIYFNFIFCLIMIFIALSQKKFLPLSKNLWLTVSGNFSTIVARKKGYFHCPFRGIYTSFPSYPILYLGIGHHQNGVYVLCVLKKKLNSILKMS